MGIAAFSMISGTVRMNKYSGVWQITENDGKYIDVVIQYKVYFEEKYRMKVSYNRLWKPMIEELLECGVDDILEFSKD